MSRPSCHRRASAFMALLSVLLLIVMPCTTGAVAAAAEDHTVRSYVDYFLGDLFQDPWSMNRNMEPKAPRPPRFRPWRIIDVPDDGVLAFDCAGDVPTLRIVPRSDDPIVNSNDGTLPPTDNTCGGGAQVATTPMQYKFTGRPGDDNDTRGFSALFWGRPTSAGEEEDGAPPPLMPVPKFQLKAILKVVAALMEASWRQERGGEAMPDSVAFSADMVVFYFNIDRGNPWLVAMGREDVEFRQPWEKLNGMVKALNVGTVIA